MWTVDQFGRLVPAASPDMLVPVRCRKCDQVYDLCDGEPVQRFADCTVYRTPCCNQVVDDREWGGNRAFDRLRAAPNDDPIVEGGGR